MRTVTATGVSRHFPGLLDAVERGVAHVRMSGTPRGTPDLIIAAHAAETGRMVLTRDAAGRFGGLSGTRAIDALSVSPGQARAVGQPAAVPPLGTGFRRLPVGSRPLTARCALVRAPDRLTTI